MRRLRRGAARLFQRATTRRFGIPHAAVLQRGPSLSTTTAAYVFAVLVGAAILFQLALAAGMPWGNLAWGGKFPNELPVYMRVASVASALLLLGFGMIVSARAGIALTYLQPISRVLVWVVVGYCALGVIANALTPSAWERIIWLPTTALLLACSFVVAAAA